ncbi:MAG: transcriptional repressor [Candidatus Omnitrophica bacterium]|nr:transcriptional repressor [Candidatus Omnitrophota bacterium]
MTNRDAIEIFHNYLATKNLKHSEQRMSILQDFLDSGKHLTAHELFVLVQKKTPSVGFATIYRTLKLLCECGLCRELKLDDGTTRYEYQDETQHHDHLICTKCGKFVEVLDPEIERLQDKLFDAYGFLPQRHRLDLYGICKSCNK